MPSREAQLKVDLDMYLIWSNLHEGWWGPNETGYVPGLVGAGTYARERALEICRRSIPNAGHLGRIATIPVRYADVLEFIAGQMMPAAFMRGGA